MTLGTARGVRRRAIATAVVVVCTGFSAISTASSAGAATVPGAPGKPVVYAMNGGVSLQWSAPANVGSPPLTGYRVDVNNGSGWTVATPERTAVAIAAGGEHTCALLNGGAVKCWGFNQYGQLGVGDTKTRGDGAGEMGDNLPSVALGTGRTALAIAAGFYHTCAILDTRAVKCWGLNNNGQLGLGHTLTRGAAPGQIGDFLQPVALGAGRTALAIAAGGDTTCALLDNHTVKCWGLNSSGQLGVGDNSKRGDDAGEMGANLPAVALGTGRTAVAIATGGSHSCAVLDNGTVKCWGANEAGQLGLGDGAPRGDGPGEMGNNLPAVALGAGRTAIAIGVGSFHTCAVLNGGSVKCWGTNQNGQLGLGDVQSRGDNPGEMGDSLPAVALGTGRTAFAVVLGADHACALLDGGRVKCWGNNNHGQLGVGDIRARGHVASEMGNALPAVSLGTGRTAIAVAAGGNRHSCALFFDGAVKCWGFNAYGKLGLGDTVTRGAGLLGDSLVPVALGTVTSIAVRSAAVRLPRGTYQFRIVALSSAGAGAPSVASAPLTLAAVPAAPTGLVGEPGNQSVTLTWDAPGDDGGSPVVNYEVTALTTAGEPVGSFGAPTRFVGSAATTLTFTGLLNGANFKFKVAAINAVGAGTPVQLADPVKPIAVASQVRDLRVDSGSDAVTMIWEPPLQNGGSPITSYQVSVFDGAGGPATGVTGPTTRSRSASGPGLPPRSFSFGFDGLTLGTAYTFRVSAVSNIGTGPSSATQVIVVGAPTAPLGVKVSPGATGATTGALTVSIASSYGNGSPITSYTVTCTSPNGGATVTKTGSKPVTFTGLLVGKQYDCIARSTNARGTGGPSAPATGFVGAPGAPTGVSAIRVAPGEVQVSFVAPADHGSPITQYIATCVPHDPNRVGWTGGGESSPVTVTNLEPDTIYDCSVYASNARGGGPVSASYSVFA